MNTIEIEEAVSVFAEAPCDANEFPYQSSPRSGTR